MDPQRQPRWRRIRRRLLLARRQLLWVIAALILLVPAILVGYRYVITLWDWLKLIVVPAVIAAGGICFNRQQRERELQIARQQ